MKAFSLLLLTLLALQANTASAENCEGTVLRVRVKSNGLVEVRGTWSTEANYPNICSLNETIALDGRVVTPETCRAWFSLLLAAKHANGTVRLADMNDCAGGALDVPESIWHRD